MAIFTWVSMDKNVVYWMYVFNTDCEEDVANHIKSNVDIFWNNYFAHCVRLVEDYVAEKSNKTPLPSTTLFVVLKNLIKYKNYRLTKDIYIDKITKYLKSTSTPDIMASMNFIQPNHTVILEKNRNDNVTTIDF